MEFQIKQNYGDGCGGYIYFNADTTDITELKKIAIKEMRDDWNELSKQRFILHQPTPPRPTITVVEHADGKTVRGGIKFKTKWR